MAFSHKKFRLKSISPSAENIVIEKKKSGSRWSIDAVEVRRNIRN
jgi:hypothetical protein